MTDLRIMPKGQTFVRLGGRDGDWWPDPQEDDSVASPFDFVQVAGGDADTALALLRRTIEGKTPVIFGSPHSYGLVIERMENEGCDPATILAGLLQFDLDEWFAEKVAEVQVWQEDLGHVVPRRGPWPRTVASKSTLVSVREDQADAFHDTILIGLVPTQHAFEAPAFACFGDGDDVPEPIVHVALAREWEARFGATVTAMTFDAIEFQVARPPKARDEAERLALEHFHYNRAAVPGTLQDAAAALVGASVWHFCWD